MRSLLTIHEDLVTNDRLLVHHATAHAVELLEDRRDKGLVFRMLRERKLVHEPVGVRAIFWARADVENRRLGHHRPHGGRAEAGRRLCTGGVAGRSGRLGRERWVLSFEQAVVIASALLEHPAGVRWERSRTWRS